MGYLRQFGNVRATSAFALKADIHTDFGMSQRCQQPTSNVSLK